MYTSAPSVKYELEDHKFLIVFQKELKEEVGSPLNFRMSYGEEWVWDYTLIV
jgi:hypothetical protein